MSILYGIAAFALGLTVAAAARAEVVVVGTMERYIARHEDTLVDLARQNKLGFVEIVAANPGVDPWLPGEGTEIILPTAHLLPAAPKRGLIVNLTEMRVYFFPVADGTPETFPIGIGREGAVTPVGTTKVVRKQADPAWYPPPSVRAEKPELPSMVPAGPDNPLGKYALYLTIDLIRIHGTNKPYGVGRRVSHGCIRMYPEDIEFLFQRVPVGSPVTVVDQPVKMGWIDGDLYMEVAPSKHQADQLESEGKLIPELAEGTLAMAQDFAKDQADRLDVAAILQASLERRGYPVRITR